MKNPFHCNLNFFILQGLRDLLYIHRTYGPFIEMMENDGKNNDKNDESKS